MLAFMTTKISAREGGRKTRVTGHRCEVGGRGGVHNTCRHISLWHPHTISKYALQSVFGPGFLESTHSLVPRCKWLNVCFAVEVLLLIYKGRVESPIGL